MKHRSLLARLEAATLSLPSAYAQMPKWSIDPAHSRFNFEILHMLGNDVKFMIDVEIDKL